MKILHLSLLLFVLSAGCSPSGNNNEPNTIEMYSYAYVGRGSGSISTIEYDGHKFILYRYDRGCGIVHHPDCKCKERKEK